MANTWHDVNHDRFRFGLMSFQFQKDLRKRPLPAPAKPTIAGRLVRKSLETW
ncbi:MAG: hypothetical protein ING01_14300 [Rhodobacter sp.]|nr:hypothetical protein [Rhodobacter sp.]